MGVSIEVSTAILDPNAAAAAGQSVRLGQNPRTAERVLMAPPWTAVTFAGTWANYGGAYQTCQYRRVVDMVQIRGYVKSGTTGTVAFVLPVGYRPPANIGSAAVGPASVAFASVYVASNGDVSIYSPGGTADVSFSFSFSLSV